MRRRAAVAWARVFTKCAMLVRVKLQEWPTQSSFRHIASRRGLVHEESYDRLVQPVAVLRAFQIFHQLAPWSASIELHDATNSEGLNQKMTKRTNHSQQLAEKVDVPVPLI